MAPMQGIEFHSCIFATKNVQQNIMFNNGNNRLSKTIKATFGSMDAQLLRLIAHIFLCCDKLITYDLKAGMI